MLQALRPRLAEIWPAASRPLPIGILPLAGEVAKPREGQQLVATNCRFSETLSRVRTGLKAFAHRSRKHKPKSSDG